MPQCLSRSFSSVCSTVGVLTLALSTATATAGTITHYTAVDDGAPVGGPFPNSSAAQSSFQSAAALYGNVSTITFEGDPLGFTTSAVTVAPGVTETQSGNNLLAGLSGISNVSVRPLAQPNLYGFNTTPGGSYFLGTTEDTTTFNFASPTNSFGFYATGLQTVASTELSLTFTDDGGAEQVNFLNLPTQGGAAYYSFTDTSSFSAVTLADEPSLQYQEEDAWGIDDVSYNTSVTPEPSSVLLLGTGLLGVLGRVRYSRNKRA